MHVNFQMIHSWGNVKVDGLTNRWAGSSLSFTLRDLLFCFEVGCNFVFHLLCSSFSRRDVFLPSHFFNIKEEQFSSQTKKKKKKEEYEVYCP